MSGQETAIKFDLIHFILITIFSLIIEKQWIEIVLEQTHYTPVFGRGLMTDFWNL